MKYKKAQLDCWAFLRKVLTNKTIFMLFKQIPPCYSFAFGTELKDKEGKIVHRNVFQIYLNNLFHDHVVKNLTEIMEMSFAGEETDKEDMIRLVTEGRMNVYKQLYRFDIKTNNQSVIYNLFLPQYNKSIPVNQFLEKECQVLCYLFHFLQMASIHFSDSEEGKEYRKISLSYQGVVPYFYVRPDVQPLSFAVELGSDDLRKVSRVIGDSNKSEEQVNQVLQSVLGAVDSALFSTVRVSIRHEYIQVQLNTDTAMIIDFSGSHDHNEKWLVISKHVDYPLQLIALFATLGRIMVLSS